MYPAQRIPICWTGMPRMRTGHACFNPAYGCAFALSTVPRRPFSMFAMNADIHEQADGSRHRGNWKVYPLGTGRQQGFHLQPRRIRALLVETVRRATYGTGSFSHGGRPPARFEINQNGGVMGPVNLVIPNSSIDNFTRLRVLLVEPDLEMLAKRTMLLSRSNYILAQPVAIAKFLICELK
jgi:hypothetical protein